MPNQYAKDTVKIKIYLKEKLRDDLVIRLKYHRMTRSEFFRACAQALIEQHPAMEDFIEHYKEVNGKYSKKEIAAAKKDLKNGEKLLKTFALSDDELEDIYDLIEEDTPEI